MRGCFHKFADSETAESPLTPPSPRKRQGYRI
jgi:hypothetical protein